MAKDKFTHTRPNRFTWTQREEMSHQVSQLANLSAYLVFTFIAVLLIDNVASSSLFEGFWRVFLGWTICAFSVWGFVLIATRFVSRALVFHLLISICTLFFIAAPLFVMIWVLQNLLGIYGWLLAAILLISMLIGYWDEFQQIIKRLQISENLLVTSGRLNKANGIWNVKVPMQTNGHDPHETRGVKLTIIAIQVVAFVLSIYLGKTAYAPLVVTLCCWLMLYFSFRQLAEPVAITVQLHFWETELDQPIMIGPDEYEA